MLAGLNLRKARKLESLQHELMCSRAALKSPVVFLLLPQDPILLMRLLPHRSIRQVPGKAENHQDANQTGCSHGHFTEWVKMFIAEEVRAASEAGAFRALPKMYRGVKGLSGSSACRWYIDEDLPETNSFHARYFLFLCLSHRYLFLFIPVFPVEIACIVSQKFRLVVSISNKSFQPTTMHMSFQVNRIDHAFKPKLCPLGFGATSHASEASSCAMHCLCSHLPLWSHCAHPHQRM